MIKEWFTARELAEFQLSGLPKTERAYRWKATQNDWKNRGRSFGKGKEYHISNLSENVRFELAVKSSTKDILQNMVDEAVHKQVVEHKALELSAMEKAAPAMLLALKQFVEDFDETRDQFNGQLLQIRNSTYDQAIHAIKEAEGSDD